MVITVVAGAGLAADRQIGAVRLPASGSAVAGRAPAFPDQSSGVALHRAPPSRTLRGEAPVTQSAVYMLPEFGSGVDDLGPVSLRLVVPIVEMPPFPPTNP